jgi:hypothetical protein
VSSRIRRPRGSFFVPIISPPISRAFGFGPRNSAERASGPSIRNVNGTYRAAVFSFFFFTIILVFTTMISRRRFVAFRIECFCVRVHRRASWSIIYRNANDRFHESRTTRAAVHCVCKTIGSTRVYASRTLWMTRRWRARPIIMYDLSYRKRCCIKTLYRDVITLQKLHLTFPYKNVNNELKLKISSSRKSI